MKKEIYRKVYIKTESDLPKDGIYDTRFGELLFKDGLWKLPDSYRTYVDFADFKVEYYFQPEQPIEHKSIPELCPICKTTFLTNRVCLTCTRKLCSPLQIEQSKRSNLTADYIEQIFRNTERIHSKSDAIDWIKLAAYKCIEYINYINQSEPFTTINKNLSEADKIIKALSGEEIKDIPTITSTDYPVEQPESNEETIETEFQKRFELLRLQKILNDHIIIDPDKLYVSLRGIEIAFDALVKSENNEIQHGIPFKCPECGKEIQFGFSDAGMKLFAKSRLFEQSERKTAEEIIIKKVGEFWWICGKHKPEFLEAMEEYRQATQPKPPEKITDEEIREKLSQMCFCKSLICKRCGFEEKICNNEEIRKDIFKYLTEMEEYRQCQPTVSDEEIENGVTELARKHAIQSVGDWVIGYITGAKAMRDNSEQFKNR